LTAPDLRQSLLEMTPFKLEIDQDGIRAEKGGIEKDGAKLLTVFELLSGLADGVARVSGA
jgi:hypothetical protein